MNKLIKPQNQHRAGYRSLTQIRGKVQSLGGHNVNYRLYEVRRAGVKSYAVNVSFGSDHASCGIGYSKRCAIALFDRLVEGFVTPTTLGEIVEDWEYGQHGEA